MVLRTATLIPKRSNRSRHSRRPSASSLVKVVRKATERFKDSAVAAAEGYALQFGCVSGEDTDAMGLHYVNFALVKDVELDPTRPEIVIYEPTADGGVNLIGADFWCPPTRGMRPTRLRRS
jgi:hypothetical protein